MNEEIKRPMAQAQEPDACIDWEARRWELVTILAGRNTLGVSHTVKTADEIIAEYRGKAKESLHIAETCKGNTEPFTDEDEGYLNIAIRSIACDLGEDSGTVRWLKALPGRIKLQPQQERPELDLEKAARHVYESWMGSTMDDFRRDMLELGELLDARKEGEK